MWSKRKLVVAAYGVIVSSLGGLVFVLSGFSASTELERVDLPATVVAPSLSAGDVLTTSEQEASSEPNMSRIAIKESLRTAVQERLAVAPPVRPDSESSVVMDRTLEASGQVVDESRLDQAAQLDRTIQWCDATIIEQMFLAAWPDTVRVDQSERATVFSAAVPVVASGTQPTQVALMQFPLRPASLQEPACLKHAYIGVTTEGRLIHTNDTILYASRGAEELIGYAFDGNPIYGQTDALLDQCGGNEVAGEYRYQLSAEDDFIIGCFVSQPQQVLARG